MNIAVITIHSVINYGAVFQAYATYSVLSDFGDTELINYQNNHFKKIYAPFKLSLSRHLPKQLISNTLMLYYKLSKQKKFNLFQKKHIKFTKQVSDNQFNLKNYNYYVCGSDQIWNPRITNGNDNINPVYFLDFLPETAKKISYASSLGNYRYSPKQELEVKKKLIQFKSIAVREQDGQEYLNSILSTDVEQVLDPTLLLTRDDWISNLNLKTQTTPKKYILVYSVPRTPLIKEAIEFFSKKLQLPVIAIDGGLRKFGKVDKQIRNASPEDFLTLFLNASFIITDSFHGVCFSINFNKQFAAISSGQISNRMQNILNIVSLTTQLVENTDDLENIREISPQKYKNVSKELDKNREKSFSYLKRNLV